MSVNKATVGKVEVFGGCSDGHDPVLPEGSAPELTSDVGSRQGLLDSGNSETYAIFCSSVEALG